MMETNFLSTLIAMTGFALATSASPGPVNIVSAMSGAQFGVRKTVPYVLGATIGFVSILAITGSGFGPLITRSTAIQRALALLGSLYMLYLAYKLGRASVTGIGRYEKISPPNIISGILSQYSNPKAWIVSISAISIYVSAAQNYNEMLAIFCCVFFAICFPSLWMWSFIGSSFSAKASRLKIFNISMAFLLALSIIMFILNFFRTS